MPLSSRPSGGPGPPDRTDPDVKNPGGSAPMPALSGLDTDDEESALPKPLRPQPVSRPSSMPTQSPAKPAPPPPRPAPPPQRPPPPTRAATKPAPMKPVGDLFSDTPTK